MASKSRGKAAEKGKFIVDDLKDEYELQLPAFDSGGTGIVFRARRTRDVDSLFAVKLYVPSADTLFPMPSSMKHFMLPDSGASFDAEMRFLRRTNHPSVQEVVGWGTISDPEPLIGKASASTLQPGFVVRFLVSRWIDGTSLSAWAKSLPPGSGQLLLSALAEIGETLAYVHDVRKYQHGDIQAANVLVHSHTQRPILIDFGNAYCFDISDPELPPVTKVRQLPKDTPAALIDDLRTLVKKHGSDQVPREELRNVLFPGLDLFHFGQLLEEVLALGAAADLLSDRDRDFVRLVARQLRDWHTAKETTAAAIAAAMRRLMSGPTSRRSEHGREDQRTVALPRSHMRLDSATEAILKTQGFRRLQLLHQLSLLYLVYPGATQTRFEHLLGTYECTQRLIRSLRGSARFMLLFDDKEIRKLLATALLHDLNHFPFLHYFQELKVPALHKVDLWDFFGDGQATSDAPSIYQILADAGIDPQSVKRILVSEWEALENPADQVIKSIIDSGLDVDKITYVRDDAIATGVPFGRGIDETTLLESADIVEIQLDAAGTGASEGSRIGRHLCFREEGLSAVESVLLARYWNFKQIYWHHTNRALGAMIIHTIYSLFVDKGVPLEEYLRETLGRGEAGALEYLAQKYRTLFGRPSILEGVASRRDRLFKRLYSVKYAWGGTEDSTSSTPQRRLFDDLQKLPIAQRKGFLDKVGLDLARLFASRTGLLCWASAASSSAASAS